MWILAAYRIMFEIMNFNLACICSISYKICSWSCFALLCFDCIIIFKIQWTPVIYHIPLHQRWNGVILDLSWCLSVCEKVFAQFIWYLVLTITGWAFWFILNYIFLPLISAMVPKFLPENGVSKIKKKTVCSISYLAFYLIGWVSWPLFILTSLPSIVALWWPNICPKMHFPDFSL